MSYESEPLDLDLARAEAVGIWAKGKTPQGVAPAVALINPRYAHNIGGAVRAASCFGIPQVWWTGDRVRLDPSRGERLPREERMKGYKRVQIVQFDRVFDQFGPDVTPVAVELRPNAERLPDFVHPDKALYVFGPEDSSLSKVELIHCHRFMVIPTEEDENGRPFCTNLAAAVYLVLYDRMVKLGRAGRTA